jgi:hypothetical protein
MCYRTPPCTRRHNVELPWVSRAREMLLELLAAPPPTVRRAAAEGMALMAAKVCVLPYYNSYSCLWQFCSQA